MVNHVFKNIDRGFLEILGPSGLYITMRQVSRTIIRQHSGLLIYLFMCDVMYNYRVIYVCFILSLK